MALSTADILATGIVIYYLNNGVTLLGLSSSAGDTPIPDIEVSGEGVVANHCSLQYDGEEKGTPYSLLLIYSILTRHELLLSNHY